MVSHKGGVQTTAHHRGSRSHIAFSHTVCSPSCSRVPSRDTGIWRLLEGNCSCSSAPPVLCYSCACDSRAYICMRRREGEGEGERGRGKEVAAHLRRALDLLASEGVELPDAVHAVGGGQRWVVPAALVRDDVDQHRACCLRCFHVCTCGSPQASESGPAARLETAPLRGLTLPQPLHKRRRIGLARVTSSLFRTTQDTAPGFSQKYQEMCHPPLKTQT